MALHTICEPIWGNCSLKLRYIMWCKATRLQHRVSLTTGAKALHTNANAFCKATSLSTCSGVVVSGMS